MKLSLHKTRDGNSRSSRSKRRYTKLDQFDNSMELRSKSSRNNMYSEITDSQIIHNSSTTVFILIKYSFFQAPILLVL